MNHVLTRKYSTRVGQKVSLPCVLFRK